MQQGSFMIIIKTQNKECEKHFICCLMCSPVLIISHFSFISYEFNFKNILKWKICSWNVVLIVNFLRVTTGIKNHYFSDYELQDAFSYRISDLFAEEKHIWEKIKFRHEYQVMRSLLIHSSFYIYWKDRADVRMT